MAACASRRSTLADGEIHVWTAAFVDDDSLTSRRLEQLDDDERMRAARLVQRRHRMSFIQFRAFARQVLGGYLGVPAAEARFGVGRHGKPHLVRGAKHPEIHFNISHSGERCLLAARLGCPVGIDIEEVRDLPGAVDIARRHFTRAEADALARLEGDARRNAFFALWTHKEAAVKTLGASLAENLQRLEFALDASGHPRLVSFDATPAASDGVWLRRLDAPPGHVAALASLRPCATIVSYAWNETASDSGRAGERETVPVQTMPPQCIAARGAPGPSIRSRQTFDHPRGA
jgi:4'-phosphopantetheinyl transferase